MAVCRCDIPWFPRVFSIQEMTAPIRITTESEMASIKYRLERARCSNGILSGVLSTRDERHDRLIIAQMDREAKRYREEAEKLAHSHPAPTVKESTGRHH